MEMTMIQGRLGSLVGTNRELSELDYMSKKDLQSMYNYLNSGAFFKNPNKIRINEINEYLTMLINEDFRVGVRKDDIPTSVNISKGSIIFVDCDNVSIQDNKDKIEDLAQNNTVVLVYHTETQHNIAIECKLKGIIRLEFIKSDYKEVVDMRIYSMMSDLMTLGFSKIVVVSRDKGYSVYGQINNMNITQVYSLEGIIVDCFDIEDYRNLFDIPKSKLRDYKLPKGINYKIEIKRLEEELRDKDKKILEYKKIEEELAKKNHDLSAENQNVLEDYNLLKIQKLKNKNEFSNLLSSYNRLNEKNIELENKYKSLKDEFNDLKIISDTNKITNLFSCFDMELIKTTKEEFIKTLIHKYKKNELIDLCKEKNLNIKGTKDTLAREYIDSLILMISDNLTDENVNMVNEFLELSKDASEGFSIKDIATVHEIV